MASNFNIRDSFWDLMYPHHSAHSNILLDITDSLSLDLSYPTNSVPTRFLDNDQNSNSVIDICSLVSLKKLGIRIPKLSISQDT